MEGVLARMISAPTASSTTATVSCSCAGSRSH